MEFRRLGLSIGDEGRFGAAARRSLLFVACGLALFATLWPSEAAAHPLAPALFQIEERSDGEIELLWKTSRLQPRGSRLRPRLTPDCPATKEPVLHESASSLELRWQASCGPAGLVGRHVAIEGLERAKIDALVRIDLGDGRTISKLLRGRDAGLEIPERQAKSQVLTDYLGLGFVHILTGPDHLAFVLGLMMLVAGRRRLIQTVTAFTLGHSVTLTLAALGITRAPPGPIEFAIALSVLLLAVEIARPETSTPGAMRRRPWLVASGFGLLHGMGFAGALAQVGLPGEEIPLALFSFNLGIELGQILFIVVVLGVAQVAGRLIDERPLWRSRVVAYAIGGLAAFWCFERAAELF